MLGSAQLRLLADGGVMLGRRKISALVRSISLIRTNITLAAGGQCRDAASVKNDLFSTDHITLSI